MRSRPYRPPHLETPAEELASVITHGLAAIAAAVLFVGVITRAVAERDAWRVASAVVYALGMVALFAISAIYHAHPVDHAHKRRWRSADHAAIYLLIAATYTPVLLVAVRGPWGWGLFAFLWIAAVVGVWLKVTAVDRNAVWSTLTYVLMGWAGVVAIRPLYLALGPVGFAWILAGGLLYTVGVAFYAWDRLPFNHAIWHCFVAAASACHFVAIGRYVLPVG